MQMFRLDHFLPHSIVALSTSLLMLVASTSHAGEVTGSLSTARLEPVLSNLVDGRVLVIGGHTVSGSLSSMIASSEIYNPATGTFAATGAMMFKRGDHTSVRLADGRILVLGGMGMTSGSSSVLASAEIYDPALETWSFVANMSIPRRSATALTLSNGKVLVLGGNESITSTEVFDPTTNSFSPSGALNIARDDATATLLQDGRVLLVGGYDVNFVYQTSAEVWNPATGQWSIVGPMQAARARHTASLLSNGKVLIAGGKGANNVFPTASELFDPLTNSFSPSGNLTTPRYFHKVQQLSDGSIALFGGTNSSYYGTPNIERYDPNSGTWTSLSSMLSTRSGFGIAPLPNGKVLLAGGYIYPNVVNSAELFDASCADAMVSVTPSQMSFPVAGGSGTIQVTQRAGCGWAIANLPDFITVTSPTSGVGNGTINFTVAPNTAEARGFTMKIANTSVYISQATNVPPCNGSFVPSIYPTSAVFPSSGASGSISVTHDAGCAWAVSNVPSWMTITSATSGRGNGTVTYTVAPNTGAYRVNNLTIATQWFNAGQQAYVAPPAGCTSKAISSGVSVSGNLTSSACINGARGSSYYTDRYTFSAVPGKQISIQLSSSAFDSYLYLKDPNGTVLTSNDDGGGGTNSRIPATSGTYTLPAGVGGTYSIEVTSYGQRSTGAYTLLQTMN